jgi:DNA (cytosine-5)-methyltransferase 1
MLRCIKEVKPKWVIGENVRGLVNWNGGMVFHEVCDDLEREGYEVQPFLIPAAGVNAPHQRQRIWFIAYSNNNGGSSRFKQVSKENGEISEWNKNAKSGNSSSFITSDSNNEKRWGQINNNGEWEDKKQESYDRNELRNNIGSISKGTNVTNSKLKGLEGQYREWERCSEYRENQRLFSGSENKFTTTNSNGIRGCENDREHNRKSNVINKDGETGDVSDSECIRLQHGTNPREISREETNAKRKGSKFTLSSETNGNGYKSDWSNFPTKSPICGGNDGIPRELDNITFSKWRKESIKGYGNAIVPQVAFEIFKTIQSFDDLVNV